MRQLVAVLAADVVNYSKLMGEDSEATLAALRRIRSHVVRPTVSHHRGSLIKSMGDGWLVIFETVVDAVTCAMRIQELSEPEERIQLRIGVHLGDVTQEEEDVFGDGVNIAARLEAICDPGGVTISEAVHSALDGTLRSSFKTTGLQPLKNIDRSIRVWVWEYIVEEAIAASSAGDDQLIGQDDKSEPQDPVLERQEILETLQRAFARAESGHGQMAVVTGEAGAGKTTVCRRFLELTDKRATVLRGSCEDFFVPEPFGALHDVAEAIGMDLPTVVRTAKDQRTVFQTLLERLSSVKFPLVLFFEDLHWADEATLDFISFLARRIETKSILLLATTRDESGDSARDLRRVLGMVPHNVLIILNLALLSEDAVRTLLGDQGARAADLHRITGGNPFFVTELLNMAASDILPETVVTAVLARIDRLSDAARPLVNLVSVFPRKLAPELVAKLDVPDLDDAIDECLGTGVLVEVSGRLGFRHELARRAVEGTLSVSRLRSLNSTALKIRRSSPLTPASELLHHARNALLFDDVLELATRATREALKAGANREAAQHAVVLLEQLERCEPEIRAELQDLVAHALYLVGRAEEAADTAQIGADMFHEIGERRGEAEARLNRVRYMQVAGEIEASILEAEAVLDLLIDEDEDDMRAVVQARLATSLFMDGQNAAAVSTARTAQRIASNFGDMATFVNAEGTEGAATAAIDGFDAAKQILERNIEHAEAHDLVDEAARARFNTAFVGLRFWHLPEAQRAADEGIAFARTHEIAYIESACHAVSAKRSAMAGTLEDALAQAEGGLALDGQNGFSRSLVLQPLAEATLRLERSEFADVLEELRGLNARGMGRREASELAQIEAEAAWLGQIDRRVALEYLDAVFARLELPKLGEHLLFWRKILDPETNIPFAANLSNRVRLSLEDRWLEAANEFRDLGAHYFASVALLQMDGVHKEQGLDELRRMGAFRVISANFDST